MQTWRRSAGWRPVLGSGPIWTGVTLADGRVSPAPGGVRGSADAASGSRTRPQHPDSALVEPGVAGGVLAGVVGVEVDEAALDEEVADLEHVAPASGAPVRHAGPPRAVLVLAVAGALGDDRVAAGEDPVERGVVVLDRLEGAADVAEQLADFGLALGDSPLREVD